MAFPFITPRLHRLHAIEQAVKRAFADGLKSAACTSIPALRNPIVHNTRAN